MTSDKDNVPTDTDGRRYAPVSAPSVLLVGGPLDGERRPMPKADGDVAWFRALPVSMPAPVPPETNWPCRCAVIAVDDKGHRYVRTQINDGSGGTEVVYRFGTLGRRDALRLLVNHYPDRRYSPPASLDDPA